MRSALFLPILIATIMLMGFVASQFSTSPMLVMGVGAVIVFAICFADPEIGLYILIFSMLLSPEFGGSASGAAASQRGVTLRLEDFLLVVIGASWFAKNAVLKDIGLFLKTPLNGPIFLYTLACVISTGVAILLGRVNPKTGFFWTLKYVEYFIVFFMMVNQTKNSQQIKRFVMCLFVTCFIVSIIGIMQIPQGGRVSAPFEGEQGEPNTFGGYLLFIGAIAAGLWMKVEDRRMKQWLLGLIIFIVPPFLYTQSRSSYLGAIPAVFVLAWMSRRRALIIGLLLIAAMISPLFLPSAVKERIMYTFTQPEESGQLVVGEVRLDTSLSARLVSWKSAFRDWVKHPLLGYGVTGYKFLDAQIPRVLTETGVLGLWAFSFLLFTIYKITIYNLQQLTTPYAKGLTIGFLAGYTGLVFHSLGANTFIIVRIMEPFWFFMGIITVLPQMEQIEALEPASQKKGRFPVGEERYP